MQPVPANAGCSVAEKLRLSERVDLTARHPAVARLVKRCAIARQGRAIAETLKN